MCRDNGITVLDTRLALRTGRESVVAGLERDASGNRPTRPWLESAAGKRTGINKRLEGQYPYGDHPLREYDGERAFVARVQALHV